MSILPWRRTPAAVIPDATQAQGSHPLIMTAERTASCIAGVFFTVRIDGAWRWPHPDQADHHDPAVLARHHLRQQAARVLSQYSVLDLAAAQDAASTALMRWSQPIPGLEVTGSVRLTVTARDRDLAAAYARQQQALDLEHALQMRRLAHLQRVLADPDLQRVWWLAEFPERLSELQTLTDALEGLPLPHDPAQDDLRSDIRHFTDRFIATMHTPQQREIFLKALTQTLHTLGHHDLKDTAARWHNRDDPGSTPT
ncbi:hypothetical protein [Streptomyces massasporeus]|uniref:hypothetical protein n=1 Tax=Streptomyces massasporeus TaxID=67324 RepID=UPI00369D52B3